MRNFTKEETELESDLDRWLYVLQNMSKLDKISTYLRKPIFEKLFKIAEYAKLNKEERAMYDVSLKRKWDAEAVRQYQEQQLLKATEDALKQGLEEGIEKGRLEERVKSEAEKLSEKLKSALEFKKMGLAAADIAKGLGLTIEQIEQLK